MTPWWCLMLPGNKESGVIDHELAIQNLSYGLVNQLGDGLLCTQKVVGSSPIESSPLCLQPSRGKGCYY